MDISTRNAIYEYIVEKYLLDPTNVDAKFQIQREVNDWVKQKQNKVEAKKGQFVIIDLRNMDYMKTDIDSGEIEVYDDLDEACTVCGFVETEDAWVCELKYNHRESEIWPEYYDDNGDRKTNLT